LVWRQSRRLLLKKFYKNFGKQEKNKTQQENEEEQEVSEKSDEEELPEDAFVQRIKKSPYGLRGSPSVLTKKRSSYTTSSHNKPKSFRVGEYSKKKKLSNKKKPEEFKTEEIKQVETITEQPIIVNELGIEPSGKETRDETESQNSSPVLVEEIQITNVPELSKKESKKVIKKAKKE